MVRERVETLRKRLRDADALLDLDEFDRAGQLASEISKEAAALSYCPLEVEVMEIHAESKLPRDFSELEQTIELAEKCGHDRIVARAAIGLAWGYTFRQPDLAERFAHLARSAIARIGGDDKLEGWLETNLSSLFMVQGRFAEGKEAAARAVAIKERYVGPRHIDTARSLSNLAGNLEGLGDFEAALKEIDRAMPIVRAWSNEVALALVVGTRSEIIGDLGRLSEAEQGLRESLQVLERRTGLEIWTSRLLGALGDVLTRDGRAAEAIPYLERARTLQRNDSPFAIADVKFALAQARAALAPRDSKALELANEAALAYATTPYFERQRAEIAAWLATHAKTRRGTHRGATHATARRVAS
jgi:tetratricopeptide (TPR) repeat protein